MGEENKLNVRNLGDIYTAINIDSRDFEKNDSEKLFKKKEDAYVKFCKKIHLKFPQLAGHNAFSPEIEQAVNFLNWNLQPQEYHGTFKFILLLGLLLLIIIISILFIYAFKPLSSIFGNIFIAYIIIFGLPAMLYIYIIMQFKDYPIKRVKQEKLNALIYVPEILGYFIMSIKLVPNLEKAIEFASQHGHGKIADDLKILLWEVKVGIHNSVSEALDNLAYKWGEISTEFKKGLMRIRASIIESSEAKRYQLLDKTMDDTLKSIKDKLEDYARSLSQPSMIMFYLGVLLPLLLIIILPIGSAFSGSALSRPIYLIMIYNIILPISCILFARYVIKNKPPTYNPPVIPDNHPKLPPKNTILLGSFKINLYLVIIVIFVIGLFTSLFLQSTFGKTKANVLEAAGYNPESPVFECYTSELELLENNPDYVCEAETEFWMQPENDVTPHYLIFGLLIIFSVIISIWLYFTSIYKRKLQIETEKMETEFKDALYLIASRLAENKPIEDALEHTKNFLPNAVISQNIFGKTIDNIRILGLNLESALFDKNYGALKNNPSNIINSAMQLLTDSVKLGVSVASKTLISYSLQLRNTDEVNKMLSNLIVETTNTLKTMAKFIIPIILGITTALQKIVISTLISVLKSGAIEDMTTSMQSITSGDLAGTGVETISQVSTLDASILTQLASPTTFLIIVAIYVIQIIFIMIYFTTMIEQNNITLMKIRIAQTLPLSIIIFIAVTLLANMIF